MAARRSTLLNKNSYAFTPEQVAECRELFAMFDKDNDGEIDRQAFGPMMKKLGLKLTEQELDKYFAEMDESGDGSLEFAELVGFLERMARPSTLEEELTEAFFCFDPCKECDDDDDRREDDEAAELDPKDRVISKTLLAKTLKEMGEDVTEAECLDMITVATNGLEAIDFDTFKRFCKSGRRSPSRRPGTRGG